MQTKKLIERHYKKAEKALETGNYDLADAELTTVITMTTDVIKELKANEKKKDIKETAQCYKRLLEIQALQAKAKFLLEAVEKEKERSKKFQAVVKGLQKKKIMRSIDKNQKIFEAFRDRPRSITSEKNYIKILRRWNSYTPLLSLDVCENIGGGYFLSLDNIGIVIDPGINFIRNALAAGLSVKDIDIVLLTHSHVDHTADFEGIVTLFHEINDPRYEKNLDPIQIRLLAAMGAVNKYANLLSSSYDIFKEVIVMNPNNEYFFVLSFEGKNHPLPA